ncbi:MAG: hypothetical protein HY868_08115 [Chloroflexi bacterium]|nr:hypothetical protein [Chloroflexota bacterium]
MGEQTTSGKQRPYFIWDYDLSEEDVRAILRGDNEYEKVQMMVRTMESARWEDIWNYLTLKQIRAYWHEILPKLRRELRLTWEFAIEVWSKDTPTDAFGNDPKIINELLPKNFKLPRE